MVDIFVTPPRLNDEILAPIMNAELLRERGQRVINEELVRFAGCAPLTPMKVLTNLRQYLIAARHAAQNEESPRKIQGRNKLFALSFSDDCDRMLEYLDFVRLQEKDPELQTAVSVAP